METKPLNEIQKAAILEKQMAGWGRVKVEAKKGNPWATLCLHCYGRHAPPRDAICPNEPLPK